MNKKTNIKNVGILGWSSFYKNYSKEKLVNLINLLKKEQRNIVLHSSTAYSLNSGSDINLILSKLIKDTNLRIQLKICSQPKELKSVSTIINQIKKYKVIFGNSLIGITIHRPRINKRAVFDFFMEKDMFDLRVGICLESLDRELIEFSNFDLIEMPLNILDFKLNSELFMECQNSGKDILIRSALASGLLSKKNICLDKTFNDPFRKRFSKDMEALKDRKLKSINIEKYFDTKFYDKNYLFEYFCYDVISNLTNNTRIIFGGTNLEQLKLNLNYQTSSFSNEMGAEIEEKVLNEWSARYYQ
tara:strand:- start:890 stop:1795 length:906 start_codon:yes stop_codon:yes gene_type:complete